MVAVAAEVGRGTGEVTGIIQKVGFLGATGHAGEAVLLGSYTSPTLDIAPGTICGVFLKVEHWAGIIAKEGGVDPGISS